jgi:probable phosphomutase (TIGR03848 family)
MTTLLLVRHAECDGMGRRLNGRREGVRLTEAGRAQAAALAERLATIHLAAVITSPLERARETARAIAAPHGLTVEEDRSLVEIDFGRWTGAEIASLAGDPDWGRWNRERASARCPGGESMLEVQTRAWKGLERQMKAREGAVLAAVSHADVIRAVLAPALGLPLDQLLRIEIAPASVSVVRVDSGAATVLGVNQTGELPEM